MSESQKEKEEKFDAEGFDTSSNFTRNARLVQLVLFVSRMISNRAMTKFKTVKSD